MWACGAAGSALPWHGRGHRFDPDQVHHRINKLANRLEKRDTLVLTLRLSQHVLRFSLSSPEEHRPPGPMLRGSRPQSLCMNVHCRGDVGGAHQLLHHFDVFPIGFEQRGVRVMEGMEARVKAGLVPATRREVFERIRHLETPKYPFANLPELAAGRWGQGLTAEKMKECVWLRPEAVAQIQF